MKELEDSPYFPPLLRNFQTEFIGFVVSRFNAYSAFVKYINLYSLPEQAMIDLCSGSGEPAISIFQESNIFTNLVLSDKFPLKPFVNSNKIYYVPDSVDVLEIEFKSDVCYTMFNAFHHFKDEDKVKIVQQIIASGSRSYFVEILEPKFICFLKVLFITTIGNLLFTPFIQPFSFKRLLFTYILPINIITILYDGLVSVLKSRNVKQYRKLFAGFENSVKIFKLKNKFNSLIVIGVEPK
jgi:hypothetical protein